MLKLLREHEVASALKAARRKGGQASVAAAFWGKGGAAKLGFKVREDARVICNLDQIGCNPDAIQELRDLGIKVKTHPRLHAKIYATATIAIIGSSNASTNGLTVEGVGALGWKEANIITDDAEIVAEALSYFDEIWDSPDARHVTKAELRAASARRREEALWLLNPPQSKTLIAACRERPELFKEVIVYPYDKPLSIDADKRFSDFTQQATTPELKGAWGYEDENIPKGVWIIDLDCKPDRKHPKVWGCSRWGGVLKLDDGAVTIGLRGVVTVGTKKYKISSEEKQLLEAAGHKLLLVSRHRYITLPEAVRIAEKKA